MSDWTKEQTDTLRSHWRDFSAAEIASLLGKSRNAVIGKVHRLALPAKSEIERHFVQVRGCKRAYARGAHW